MEAQPLLLKIENGDKVGTLKEEIAKAMVERRTAAKTYPVGPTLIRLKDPNSSHMKSIKATIFLIN